MSSSKNKSSKKKKKVVSSGKPQQAHKETCFIVCPFGGWNDRYCSEVFEPAVQAAGLEAARADDLYRPSAIVHDIWDYVKKARVVLAELTGKNPNVLYELGLAHAVGKPVIMVTRSMDDVPFDLRSLRVIAYDVEDPEWSGLLRDSIKRALSEVLQFPEQAVPPPFLHVRKTGRQPSVSPLKRRLLEMEQQIELLRAETRGSRVGSPRISADEAGSLIERYLRTGLGPEAILDIVTRRGVPESWARQQILRHFEMARRVREPVKTEPPQAPPPPSAPAEGKTTEEKY